MTAAQIRPGPTRQPEPERGGLFSRMATFAGRHRWTALILWVVVLAGVWTAASSLGDEYRDDYTLPDTDTYRATQVLKEHGTTQGDDTVEIVLHREQGSLRGAGTERDVQAMLADVAKLPGVADVRGFYDDPTALTKDGSTGYASVSLEHKAEEMPVEQTRKILDTARELPGNVQVDLGGEAARALAEDSGGAAEGAGIIAALVILVFMFGSVVAAGLPVITALFAVGSTMGIIVLASHVFTVATYTPYMMMLVGLGVGIDYALLIFARFRTELDRGADHAEATRRALDVAGRTVSVAGCTVIVALIGLMALGLGALRGVAISVALTILVTMLASLTLLPALLAIFGARFARQFAARAAKREAKGRPESGTRWRAWGAAVQRRPIAALVVSVLLLGALAIPALSMRLGLADAGNDPSGSTSRNAYDRLATDFGAGVNGPLVIVVEAPDARQAGGALVSKLDDVPGITQVSGPIPAGDKGAATVIAFPDTAPQDEATTKLVHHLRDDVLPGEAKATDARYLVGGPTAAVVDYSDTVGDRMPLFIAIVVGVSVLLLIVVFRSLLVPLKAAVLNLLSIGAALGAVTLVFQEGWLGAEPGPVQAFLPVMIFAIVFGLSMDYEIFLIARMREEWQATGDHAHAVREGLARTGAVITAAGAIMIVVFGAFLFSDDRMLRQFGFGLAVAILIDAVLIRCLVVPAVMQLLGRRAWWLPKPLDRALPRVTLEKD